MNVGIIGLGRIGRVHGLCSCNAGNGVHVKAAADPALNDDMREWAADLGIENVYEDYHRILDDASIEAVLICTPTATHFPISVEAIRAGKHVFCEKPVAFELDKIKEVKKLVEETGLVFQVGFNQRLDKSHNAVREALVSGEIGKIHTLRITSRDPAPPPIEYIQGSGGIFQDMMIHDFDLARFICGCEPEWIWATGSCLVDAAFAKYGDCDTALVMLKMENGALVSIENSRLCAYGYDQRVEAFGELGMACSENKPPVTTIVSTADGVKHPKPEGFFLERYSESYSSEIRMFLESIMNHGLINATIDDAMCNTRIAIAAGLSLKLGRAVKLSEIE